MNKTEVNQSSSMTVMYEESRLGGNAIKGLICLVVVLLAAGAFYAFTVFTRAESNLVVITFQSNTGYSNAVKRVESDTDLDISESSEFWLSDETGAYDFEGWYFDSDFENEVENGFLSAYEISGRAKNKRLTLYARWTYTVRFIVPSLPGNSGPNTVLAAFKTDKDLDLDEGLFLSPPDATGGYVCDGWFRRDGGDNFYGNEITAFSELLPGNAFLYAKWVSAA